jgi:hypothetical protein
VATSTLFGSKPSASGGGISFGAAKPGGKAAAGAAAQVASPFGQSKPSSGSGFSFGGPKQGGAEAGAVKTEDKPKPSMSFGAPSKPAAVVAPAAHSSVAGARAAWPPPPDECVSIHKEASTRFDEFMKRKKDPAQKDDFKAHFEPPHR